MDEMIPDGAPLLLFGHQAIPLDPRSVSFGTNSVTNQAMGGFVIML